jgi:transcriptional regulator with XRE-family HTH domain
VSISGTELKTARALLAWPRIRLAARAGLSESIVAQFETGRRETDINGAERLKDALEAAGVVFVPGCDPRVTVRKVIRNRENYRRGRVRHP